ncbi:MAG: hypothetical protein RIB84_28600 [Sneathiellaceae bacterium]
MMRRGASGTGLARAPHGLVLAAAVMLMTLAGASDSLRAAGGGQDAKSEEAPAAGADAQQLVQLDPIYAPMSPPDRGGRPQAALTMQLVVGPEGSAQQIRALMPRLRDALIRDFFAYPITQTGDFPDDMLPAVTKRVMNIATRVYGTDVVSGVLFAQILKIGC